MAGICDPWRQFRRINVTTPSHDLLAGSFRLVKLSGNTCSVNDRMGDTSILVLIRGL